MALRYLPGNPFKHIRSARPPFTFHWRQPFFYLMAPRPGQEREVHPHVPLPPSYVFVKKGDPYITRHCRQLTKETGKDVYVVVDHHTRRPLGLRVPHHIHTTVLAADAATKAARAAATAARDAKLLAAAHSTLLRLFPRAPPAAADAVVAHAFRKRSGRVGRAGDVGLEEKKRGGKTAAAAAAKVGGGGVVTARKPRTKQKRTTVSKSSRVTKGPRKPLKGARTRRTKKVARVR
ncbi:hypothetical protein SLS58_011145 [Diplodia intermedia]|uniref:DUF2293 domain-containing protein n=1 Tax=Diplodia intermedia TaxID=856260 RepID=A0ABR3T148_9PEZI